MKNVEKFRNKRILILGLAKSGLAAAKVLQSIGATVIVNDNKPFEENEAAKELEKIGIEVICGGHPIEILDDHFDFIIKNPGIPYSNPIIVKAIEKGITVLTEIELAYHISQAEFIGITGSNGKTTTTTLIFEMLKQGDKKPLIAGNIGTVACEVAQNAIEENIIVTELSSFQLMGIEEFSPKIAVLLNIFDAHLDYHGTKQNYIAAKSKIFENQTKDDYCVYNLDDQNVVAAAEISKARKVAFSTKQILNNGTYIKDQTIYFDLEKIINISEIALPGKHNLENILAAVSVAKLFDVPNKAIIRVLTKFTGVKHRTQYVETIQGRKFYNDSKATNILATKAAISAFDNPIILLAGGLDRGNEFDELIEELKCVKALVVFGQTAKKLERAGKAAGIEMINHVDNVEAAVREAFDLSNEGDIILLSPACASWDQHKTFEERGDIFIDAVHKLK
ncbi:UDP-N-acetylmuramoyl-L-alanine--D-glutamate ligase [Fredinandcohnia quinoae]|uniref:UDP-N-acetylmuramoylalanine--D-glutamate ligase n=1 Tax=Fredinandcohnia quinoae TaxID=2918902 RepID=A0AAW5E3E3_9BACI|nr:UDP-N-acetylmuramoyl-L-alanine--D-glutamate ligase [Fredinandcohnia sp. SECRCQ15]MCH1623876.1 UDP-N-acetylmuramoyl-L-alanine--D-glutamate ligase [Fredinandcohnia sp. SECRCQ15]